MGVLGFWGYWYARRENGGLDLHLPDIPNFYYGNYPVRTPTIRSTHDGLSSYDANPL